MEAGFRSQAKASVAAGLSKNTLKAYEGGRAIPAADKLYDLARLYNTTVGWLLGKTQQREELPTGMVLVDQRLVDRVLGTENQDELTSFIESDPAIISCMVQIPEGGRLVSPDESLKLNQRILTHLQTYAPSAVQRWKNATLAFVRLSGKAHGLRGRKT